MRVCRFDLAFDLKPREQGNVILVQLQSSLRVRRHEALHVLLRFLESGFIVDQDLADIIGQVVAHGPRDRIALTEDQKWGGAFFGRRLDLFVLGLEVIQIPLQLLGGSSNARRPHDGAHPVGDLELVHDFTHLVTILALDTAGHATSARIVGHENQEPAREAEERRERRTFGTALFLLYLHDELLTFRQQLADVHPPALRGLAKVIARDFLQRQEAVALRSVIDETGFERGLYAGDSAFVYVSFLLFAGR